MDILEKEELIKKAGDLKVLPFVARKVLDTMNDENFSVSDLNNIVEKDQTITARVLKISNSALYGLRYQVNSLQQALLILGLKTIRSLVLAVSTRSLYKKFGITEQKIWDHSVGTAISAKMIAAGLGTLLEEVAFTGGLMHDLGKVVMNNEIPEAFAEVMMKTYNEGVDSIAAEKEICGYDHTEVGSKVAEKWGISNILIEILAKHHLHNSKLEDMEDPAVAQSIACVNLADNVCKVLGIGYRSPDDTILLHTLPSAVFLKMTKDKLDTLCNEINDTYNSEKAVFQ